MGVNEGDELIINLFLYGSIFRDCFPSGGSGDLTTVTWVAKSKLDKSLLGVLNSSPPGFQSLDPGIALLLVTKTGLRWGEICRASAKTESLVQFLKAI